jgi:O-antigen/teichoic acid export membrane protein
MTARAWASAVWRGSPRGHARDGAGKGLGMAQNSVALILGKVSTMGLGFLFWLVAARLFKAHEVGLAAGAISAMMLCTQLALLGVGSAVISLFPEHRDDPARLLDTAFTFVIGTGLVAGAIFLGLAGSAFHNLSAVASQPLFAAGFLAMSVMGTAGIVFDQASTVLRRGDQMLVRGTVQGLLTLVAVVPVLLLPGGGRDAAAAAIFGTWVAGGVAMCAYGVVQLRRVLPGYHFRLRLAGMTRRLLVVGLPNHFLTLADRAPALILPVIITELLSPTDNAHWYAVWMMAWVIFIIPIQVGMTLFAEASHRSKPLPRLLRQGMGHSLKLGVAAAAAMALAAPLALAVLGHGYSVAGSTPLRILVIAFIPMTCVQAYYAACRARRRLREATLTATVNGLVSLAAAAVVGPKWGLNGIAIVWVSTQVLTAVWVMTRMRKVVTSPEPPLPTAAEVESVEAEIATPGVPVPAGVGSDG